MTDEPLVLGIDFGTSAAKAVLATVSGRVLARASAAQSVSEPGSGKMEQDPDIWWLALRKLVAKTMGPMDSRGSRRLAGLALSGHYPTLILCDADGHPLIPALLYSDTRADAWVAEATRLAGEPLMGDELVPKLLWLQHERPDLLAATRRLCYPQEHVLLRLTGSCATDHRRAARSGGLFDRKTLRWRPEVMKALGLDVAMLPRIARPGDVAGQVAPAAAEATGIPAGTPVLVGFGDTPAALLGAGVVLRHEILLYYGTTTTADVCTHDMVAYLLDPTPIAEGAPYREVSYAVLGPALPWAARGFGPSEASSPDLGTLDKQAALLGTKPDAPYVLPYFVAHPRDEAPPRRPAIIGLDIHHSRADLHRALLESFGYIIRAGLEDSGMWTSARRFVAAGGGARSEAWRQIVSDVLGVEQAWLPNSDGALGDAMLAAWATGSPDTLGEGLSRWLSERRVVSPDPAAAHVQESRYRTWRRLVDSTTEALRG